MENWQLGMHFCTSTLKPAGWESWPHQEHLIRLLSMAQEYGCWSLWKQLSALWVVTPSWWRTATHLLVLTWWSWKQKAQYPTLSGGTLRSSRWKAQSLQEGWHQTDTYTMLTFWADQRKDWWVVVGAGGTGDLSSLWCVMWTSRRQHKSLLSFSFFLWKGHALFVFTFIFDKKKSDLSLIVSSQTIYL